MPPPKRRKKDKGKGKFSAEDRLLAALNLNGLRNTVDLDTYSWEQVVGGVEAMLNELEQGTKTWGQVRELLVLKDREMFKILHEGVPQRKTNPAIAEPKAGTSAQDEDSLPTAICRDFSRGKCSFRSFSRIRNGTKLVHRCSWCKLHSP